MHGINRSNKSMPIDLENKNKLEDPQDQLKGLIPQASSQIDKSKDLSERSVMLSENKFKVLDGSPIALIERIALELYPSDLDIDLSVKRIRSILEKNPELSINEVMKWDWGNVTPLMAITANGCSRMSIALIQKLDANPFIKDSTRKNLLHLIVSKGHCDDRYLNPTSRENQTPLFDLVLEHDSIKKHINDQDIFGLTPLHYACARRNKEYIKKLIKCGADASIKDANGNSCFEILTMDEQTRVNIIALALSDDVLSVSEVMLNPTYQINHGSDYCICDSVFKKIIVGRFNEDFQLSDKCSPVEKEDFNIPPEELLHILETNEPNF